MCVWCVHIFSFLFLPAISWLFMRQARPIPRSPDALHRTGCGPTLDSLFLLPVLFGPSVSSTHSYCQFIFVLINGPVNNC